MAKLKKTKLELVWSYTMGHAEHQVLRNPESKQYKYVLSINGRNEIDTEMYLRKAGVVKAIEAIERSFTGNIVSNAFSSTIKKRTK